MTTIPMSAPRPEVPTAYQELTGQRLEDTSLDQLDVDLQKNEKLKDQLKAKNITREDLQDHINGMQKSTFKKWIVDPVKTGLDVVTWPVRKILWPTTKFVWNNKGLTFLALLGLGYFGLPALFRFLADREFGFAKDVVDWFSRYRATLTPTGTGFGARPADVRGVLGGEPTPGSPF